MSLVLTQSMPPRADSGPQVDAGLPTPLYHQIYVLLRNEILTGERPHGSLLPGEKELAQQFAVSRITAKRALNELAAASLVVRERGRGTRVHHSSPTPPVRSSVEGLLENLVAMGLKTEVRLLDFEYVPASDEVAQALRCAPGAKVQRAIRLRSLEGAPLSHLTTFVPEAIGRSYDRRDLSRKPLLALLERSGVVVTSAEQTITATLADTRIARLLGVAVGSPLLRITRIVHDQAGRPVEYIRGLYRPDRYQYRMTLDRTLDHAEGRERKIWSPAAEGRRRPPGAKRRRNP